MSNLLMMRKACYVLATTGALLGVTAGSAIACAPLTTPASARAAHAVPGRRGAGSSVGSAMTSTGIHLYNNSVDKLVLTGVSGDNEGVPSVNSVLASGTGYQDFEVTFRATKSTTVTAMYDVYDTTDVELGTATIKLSNNEWDETSVSGQFTPAAGMTLPLKAGSYGSDFAIEANSSAPIDIDASSPLASDLVTDYCNTTDTDAKCTFSPSADTASTKMRLLAEGYTSTGGDSLPGTVSVSSGYNSSTSDSWSVTLTATMELANVFSEGVSATYGQSVTFQNTFSASDSIQVDPGYTGYIWGDVPVDDYTGTMQVTLGDTTYDIQNATFTTPDPTRTLSDFYAGTWSGNDPLHSPNQPPATAVPLAG